ncbi:MAG: NADPH:quinone reductase [Pseudomonadota bacterium]
MKAAAYRRFGPAAEVLEIIDRPAAAPGPGEVSVRVRASGVNPSDVKLRAGARPGGVAPEMPYPEITPHSDGAGEIDAVGDGVDPSRVGQRVWLWNGQWERAFGTAAEQIVLPAEQAAPLPDACSFAEGACLGIPATTAHVGLFADGPIEGATVLVSGGAGAVGAYAVEMAKLGGAAQVLTTVSGPEKAALAKELGADHVINYREEDVVEAVMTATAGAGVDRIVEVEFGGNLATNTEIIKPNGAIASYASMAVPTPKLPFYQLMFKCVTLRLYVVYRLAPALRRRAVADLERWLSEGRLSHRIAGRWPLAQIADAHAQVEAGAKIGAVIVDV